MELLIGIVVIFVTTYLSRKGKANSRRLTIKKGQPVKRRELTDDEIVTVILPTINNDGK